MLKRTRDRKGQNTAEYAILIALVVGAVIAMQTYVQRALNGRVFDTTKYMADKTSAVTGNGYQYEPYYTNSDYQVDKTSGEIRNQYAAELGMYGNTETLRAGNEISDFNRDGITDYGEIVAP